MDDYKIREIEKRYRVWLVIMIVAAVVLILQLFKMQILEYDHYQQQVIDNIESYKTVPAQRGEILDRNMVVLATNTKVYRVFIDPSAISSDGEREKICRDLSQMLDVDYDALYQRACKEGRADETVKKGVEEDSANLVRKYISENEFETKIYLEASSSRYYPYGSLAANVIGAMGTDGGMFGLEMKYNTYLEGTAGRYITIKDGMGHSMPSDYGDYMALAPLSVAEI